MWSLARVSLVRLALVSHSLLLIPHLLLTPHPPFTPRLLLIPHVLLSPDVFFTPSTSAPHPLSALHSTSAPLRCWRVGGCWARLLLASGRDLGTFTQRLRGRSSGWCFSTVPGIHTRGYRQTLWFVSLGDSSYQDQLGKQPPPPLTLRWGFPCQGQAPRPAQLACPSCHRPVPSVSPVVIPA